jgi:UDP-2,3-diacylglucosamine hydrolase
VSRSFFISDLHLDSTQHPQTTTLFLSFLDFVAQKRGDLYILGDLFDYWANNRIIFQKNKPILEGLSRLHQAGSRIGLLWGNRDFLLKPDYLAQFGISLWPETYSRKLQGRQVLMTHGHNLCTADSGFQRYRHQWWRIFRLLDPLVPGVMENYIARKIRQHSQQVVANLDTSGFCLSEELIQQYFDQGVDTIICGHTHHPGIRRYSPDKRLIVLPAWDTQGGYCLLEGGETRLLTYPDSR